MKIFSQYIKEDHSSLLAYISEKCSNQVELYLYDGSDAPLGLKTTVCSFWSDNFIYFIFKGNYIGLRTAKLDAKTDEKSHKTFSLWDLSDVYEVFIGPDAKKSRKYKEFQVAPDSRQIDISIDASSANRKTDFLWQSGMKAESIIDSGAKIWNAVIKIPVSAFERHPCDETIWNCNFYRISGEDNNKSYLAWCPVGQIAFHQPDKFGEICFECVTAV